MASTSALSSAQTFLAKFVYPIVFFGLPVSCVGVFFSRDFARQPGPLLGLLFFLAFSLFAASSAWRIYAPLKRVRMDERSLYISNYSTEIVVPLSNVAEVTGDRWASNYPVTIGFRVATEFGSRISFLPKVRYLPFGQHPVVEQIRRAVAHATGAGPAGPVQ